jgi:predicted N-acetyltransferase YhbS
VTAPALRTATPPDAVALAALINAAFQIERFFVDGDRTDVDEVLAYMRTGTFLLAERQGKLIGCVYFEKQGERGYFGLLAVDPAEHGKGLGRALVAAAEDALRRAACCAADIRVVDLRTELPPFYRRLGYEETGIEPFPAEVPTKRPCYFIRMSKPLTAGPA